MDEKPKYYEAADEIDALRQILPEATPAEDPIGPMYGPARRAPHYYTGETYGTKRNTGVIDRTGRHVMRGVRREIQYPDVERYPNGALPGIRDKAARRIIRGALKRKLSRVERSLGLPRAMLAQAREIARETPSWGVVLIDGAPAQRTKSPAWARKLYHTELAIHQPVYVPSQKELRAMRTQKRKDKRAGKVDAIGALVDKMSKP